MSEGIPVACATMPRSTGRVRELKHRLDTTRLSPRLYIGSQPPTGPAVARAGFDVLALCAMEYQPRSTEFPGLHAVLHIPLDDAEPTPAEVDTAMMGALGVADYVQRGQKVLVTCIQGRNRSGLVCALALHLVTCLDPRDCVAHVQRMRRGPDGLPALTNEHFIELAKRLRVAC